MALSRVGVGDRPRLLQDGDTAFAAMLSAIASARRFVLLETYIFGGRIGVRFARALAARAREGVEVSVLYDAVGTGNLLPHAAREILQRAGARLAAFRPIRRPWRVWEWRRWWIRDHRKQLVVDGQVGFLGGINIHDEELSVEGGGAGWRDTQVRVTGHPVAEMVRLFAAAWNQAGGAPLGGEAESLVEAAAVLRPAGWRRVWRTLRRRLRHGFFQRHPERYGHVQVVGSATHSEHSRIRRAYLDAFRAARRSIYITNSYFLPDLRLSAALRRAARSGVDVAILVAGESDVLPVALAARATYGGLLAAGARIFELRGRVLHAKTAVVDGTWSTVGSFNLDERSWRYNLEVNAVIVGPHVGRELERRFRDDLQVATPVLEENWRSRPVTEKIVEWIFWLLRFLL